MAPTTSRPCATPAPDLWYLPFRTRRLNLSISFLGPRIFALQRPATDLLTTKTSIGFLNVRSRRRRVKPRYHGRGDRCRHRESNGRQLPSGNCRRKRLGAVVDILAHRKQRMWETGSKLPTQTQQGRARCFCGAEIDIASMSGHVTAAHMIETADV